jgi:hypothetical protein
MCPILKKKEFFFFFVTLNKLMTKYNMMSNFKSFYYLIIGSQKF